MTPAVRSRRPQRPGPETRTRPIGRLRKSSWPKLASRPTGLPGCRSSARFARPLSAPVSFTRASSLLSERAAAQVEAKRVERSVEALGRETDGADRAGVFPYEPPAAPTMYFDVSDIVFGGLPDLPWPLGLTLETSDMAICQEPRGTGRSNQFRMLDPACGRSSRTVARKPLASHAQRQQTKSLGGIHTQ